MSCAFRVPQSALASIGRPTVAFIDAAALRANLRTIRAMLAPGVQVMAIVKADGYGHGSALVARVLAASGAERFGVATVNEAVELRENGIVQPILVLAGISAAEVTAAIEHGLEVAVVDAEMARSIASAVGDRQIVVHLKLDTGMGRLGTRPEEIDTLISALKEFPQLIVRGVFSHFSDADDVTGPLSNAQLDCFLRLRERLVAAGIVTSAAHLANSVATLTRPDTHFDMVRPGIALYGVAPAGFRNPVLRPVMQMRTCIWQLKQVPTGTPLSYEATFVTARPSRIAVLPVGYADGFDRRLSNRGEVLVHGKRAPVVGRVCMDLTLIDVTDIPAAQTGDQVVLWGSDGEAELSVREVAQWQDSIPYEVLARVGKRVPRVLVREDERDDTFALSGAGAE